MFTWISIHHEAAQRLLSYRDRQPELVALLREIESRGVEMISLLDHGPDGREIPLEVMDPWTFFAVFNRGITPANRIKAWTELKQQWNLTSPVPADFEGLPVANNQRARAFTDTFFLRRGMKDAPDAWQNALQRDPQHVPALWALFADVMQRNDGSFEPGLFDCCLSLFSIELKSLTMGLFWFKPEVVIPADAKSQEKALKLGVAAPESTAADYLRWSSELRAKGVSDVPSFSRDAHLESQGADAGATYPLAQGTFDELMQAFRDRFTDFVSFAQPGTGFKEQELDYKHKGLARFDRERAELMALLDQGRGQEALKMIQRSITLNIVNPNGWRNMFGTADAQITTVMRAVIELAEADTPDWPALFQTCQAQQVTPAWDALGELLWAIDPSRYFPFQITALRDLADWCGQKLPNGRPAADTVPAVVKFGEACREKLEPWQPRDMTDVQSWIWCVVYDENEDEGEGEETNVLREEPAIPQITPEAGTPKLWLIAPGRGARWWKDWQREGEMSIGWDHLGDLTVYASGTDIISALQSNSETNQAVNGWALWTFCHYIKPGDYVVAKRGRSRLLGYGRVISGYSYDGDRDEYANVHAVEWISTQEVDISSEGMMPMKTLTEIRPGGLTHRMLVKHYGVHLPGWIVPADQIKITPQPSKPSYTLEDATKELFMPSAEVARLVATLRRKKNLILQGPPGVGKTFIARRLAYLLMQEPARERTAMVQFHPSYAYEDFMQGLRPTAAGGFEMREGIFLRFCREAQLDQSRDYVFIIDEINRGNLAKIFGELMMLVEHDKRGVEHEVPLAGMAEDEDPFFVPKNVHLIGLMNTADRSLALVDYALRRRFAFATLRPGFKEEAFSDHLRSAGASAAFTKRVVDRLTGLNEIIANEPQLGPDFVIGHSFFTPASGVTPDDAWFADIVQHEVQPLLMEYWLDDRGQERVNELVSNLLS